MVVVRWLVDLLTHPENAGNDPRPLIAKRFEERLAQIPLDERTDERLSEVFLEVAEAAHKTLS